MELNEGKLVGRCPFAGHKIVLHDDGIYAYTCLCPGRAEGLYALTFGIHAQINQTGQLSATDPNGSPIEVKR
jgi:hypothetical protein